jgi:hypothetical protein
MMSRQVRVFPKGLGHAGGFRILTALAGAGLLARCAAARWGLALGIALVVGGCASAPGNYSRPFDFPIDTFAFANELQWEYQWDAAGKMTGSRRHPPPDYTLHCFVLARSAKQFFQHARFEPNQSIATESTYRTLVRQIIARNPRKNSADRERIVIPGYPNLREFSQAHEPLLKSECGGAIQSYFQRGHWRMIMPFTHAHQERLARQLAESLRHNRAPVVHIVRFPALTINHALLLFDVKETQLEIRFDAYDPNHPERPTYLAYDRAANTFYFPRNNYFAGGRVDVYEVYSKWNY